MPRGATRQADKRSAWRTARAGFTLAECLLAMVILGMTVAALTQAIVAGQAQTADALRQVRGSALAEALMEEVLSEPYYGPGNTTPLGPGALVRSTFNCMGNYHGFAETAGNVADQSGAAYPADYRFFSRQVTCAYGSQSYTGLAGSTTGLTVTVSVSDTTGRQWTLTQFIPAP